MFPSRKIVQFTFEKDERAATYLCNSWLPCISVIYSGKHGCHVLILSMLLIITQHLFHYYSKVGSAQPISVASSVPMFSASTARHGVQMTFGMVCPSITRVVTSLAIIPS